MSAQFNVSFYNINDNDIKQKIYHMFDISKKDYREFFAMLCAGADTGKFDQETAE